MTEINEEKLLTLNKMGLIPGPGETKDAFSERADYNLHLKDHLPEEIKNYLSEESKDPEALSKASNKLAELYDCSPSRIPLFFSNYKLPFWHGGCAWIFQMTEESPTSALIQLRKSFCNSPKYLGIYDRQELLTHELSHAGRMMFHEPKYEEVLAYRTSKSPFRRWFGPLVQSSSESALFILLLFILVVFDVFLIALARPEAYLTAFWLKAIPAVLIVGALARLWKRQKTYHLCLENLKECIGKNNPEAVAYRLRDCEIELFSKLSKDEIRNYAAEYAKTELRWKVIYKTYF